MYFEIQELPAALFVVEVRSNQMQYENNSLLFKCGSGELILEALICNRHADCMDKSDEQNCSTICTTNHNIFYEMHDKIPCTENCSINVCQCIKSHCIFSVNQVVVSP